MNASIREKLKCYQNGDNYRAEEVLGAHFSTMRGKTGVIFRVWSPSARSISVVGDFNAWNRKKTPMKQHESLGVWEAFVPNLPEYAIYKYSVEGQDGEIQLKADPYALHFETPPANASRIVELSTFHWGDKRWMQRRQKIMASQQPINIYEVHLGSWRKYADGNYFDYVKVATELSAYMVEMGYTHVELMPITEYSLDSSWGYQVTGYFSPTSRYGSPKEFMQFVNILHKAGIGVILDWVPAHFPKDEHGLASFDGSACYENPDPVQGEHIGWGTKAFNYGKPEVRSFLISSALFWLEQYHIDGLRLDTVSAMLYLDYNRTEWTPNAMGGNENLDAADFLRKLNIAIYTQHPDVLVIAEESGSWPMVTKPTQVGGLGFGYKWNTDWTNNALSYAQLDPWHRAYNHDKLTFGMFYAFDEQYILPISHNEVIRGKKSLIEKMPGDYQQKFAGMRAFLGYMMSYPGKKLLFMGCEFGQFVEWDSDKELDWMLLEYESHLTLQEYVKTLNFFYCNTPALWQIEDSWEGFQWIVPDDNSQNIIVFRRIDEKDNEVVVVINFAPVAREDYRFGVSHADCYTIALCSEEARFGGEEYTPPDEIPCDAIPMHDQQHSVSLLIPPMCSLWLLPKGLKKKRQRLKV